jgi:hypothetical protein
MSRARLILVMAQLALLASLAAKFSPRTFSDGD